MLKLYVHYHGVLPEDANLPDGPDKYKMTVSKYRSHFVSRIAGVAAGFSVDNESTVEGMDDKLRDGGIPDDLRERICEAFQEGGLNRSKFVIVRDETRGNFSVVVSNIVETSSLKPLRSPSSSGSPADAKNGW